MKRRWILFLIWLFFLTATPAICHALFYEDCENYPDLNGDWGLTENGGNLTVSTEQKRAGNRSFKFTFNPDRISMNGKRVELVLRASPYQSWEFNKEYWLGYSIYIPSDFAVPTSYAVIGQWHKAGEYTCDQAPRPENPAVAQPFMNFITGTDAQPKMNVQITGQKLLCQPDSYTYRKTFTSPAFKKGAWNDVVVHTKFRYDGSGITQMWLNGVQFINISEINAHNDTLPPYFKLGFYATSSKKHIVFFDEIRVAGANSSYNEVAPKVSNPVPQLDAPSLQIISTN